MSNVYLIGNIC